MSETPASFLDHFRHDHNARMGEFSGEQAVLDYGDARREMEFLLQGFGLVERESSGVMLVRGADAAVFLNGLATSDTEAQGEGRLLPSLFCANKGRIQHPVEVVRAKADQFLLICEPGRLEEVAGHLDTYLIREEVELGRVSLLPLDVIGPRAHEALAALELSTERPVASFHEAPLLVLDNPLGRLPRVTVLVPSPLTGAWATALLDAAWEANLTGGPVGMTAFEAARIGAGVPRFGQDYDGELLPAEAGLYNRLALGKGCYVGQEIHARLHYRGHVNRKLVSLDIPAAVGEALKPGGPLFAAQPDGEKPVGQVTSLGGVTPDGRQRGIAMVRYETVQAGAPLAPAPGAPAEITLSPLATDLGGQAN